ncbi:MAG: hypothetical protein QW840_03640 [Candidatus Bathyarchaeia archaeon]
MRKTWRIVSLAIGGTQCVLGGFASIFAYILYANQQIQSAFALSTGEVFLFMFLLSTFGIFSIASGLFLISEKEEG